MAKELQVFTLRQTGGMVQVESQAHVLLEAMNTDTRVGVALNDVERVVCRSVVGDDQFELSVTLRQNTLHALSNVSRGIVGGNANGHCHGMIPRASLIAPLASQNGEDVTSQQG